MTTMVILGLVVMGLVGVPFGLAIALGCETRWGKVLAFSVWCAVCFSSGAVVGLNLL